MSLDILDIERRILRACRTIRALPDRDRRFFALHNAWPAYVDEWGKREAEANDDGDYLANRTKPPRFRPTPYDVSDCLVALAWARGLPRRSWKLIWWRSFGVDLPSGEFKGMSYRQMAIRLGRSHDTAFQWYKDALISLWYNANASRGFAKDGSLLFVGIVEKSSRRRLTNMPKRANPPIEWASSAR